MLSPVSNVRFSSKIQVVSQEEFDCFNEPELAKRGLSADSPWTYRERVPYATEAITTDAFNCNAGGITNGEHLAMFHINSVDSRWDPHHPDEDCQATLAALNNDIRKLKAEHPNPRALLTGGYRCKLNSPELKVFLLDLFEHWGIPVSILWGQPTGLIRSSSIHYACASDTWSLLNESWSKSLLTAESSVNSLNDLKKAYSHIHIADGDQLFIGGQEIPHELAAKTQTWWRRLFDAI